MGIFSGCLIVSDIDNTLLYKGSIPERNVVEIERFKHEGGIFAIATGRAIEGAKKSYDISHSNAPLIALQGCCIYDFKNNKMLDFKTLPTECNSVFKSIIEKFPAVGAEIHLGLDIYEMRKTKRTQFHMNYENLTFKEPPENIYDINWSKALFTIDDSDTLEQVKKYCEKYDCCQFITTCNDETAIYFEMVPNGVDKGEALLKLKELTGSEIAFAIGDFYNDVEMIAAADFGATTKGAPDDIKKIAKFVTGSCQNGAVADLIIKAEEIIKQ